MCTDCTNTLIYRRKLWVGITLERVQLSFKDHTMDLTPFTNDSCGYESLWREFSFCQSIFKDHTIDLSPSMTSISDGNCG